MPLASKCTAIIPDSGWGSQNWMYYLTIKVQSLLN